MSQLNKLRSPSPPPILCVWERITVVAQWWKILNHLSVVLQFLSYKQPTVLSSHVDIALVLNVHDLANGTKLFLGSNYNTIVVMNIPISLRISQYTSTKNNLLAWKGLTEDFVKILAIAIKY